MEVFLQSEAPKSVAGSDPHQLLAAKATLDTGRAMGEPLVKTRDDHGIVRIQVNGVLYVPEGEG